MKQIGGIFQGESADIVRKEDEEREGRGDILRKWFVTVILREPLRLAVCMKLDSLEVIAYLAKNSKHRQIPAVQSRTHLIPLSKPHILLVSKAFGSLDEAPPAPKE